jgi:hypothetical protein
MTVNLTGHMIIEYGGLDLAFSPRLLAFLQSSLTIEILGPIILMQWVFLMICVGCFCILPTRHVADPLLSTFRHI